MTNPERDELMERVARFLRANYSGHPVGPWSMVDQDEREGWLAEADCIVDLIVDAGREYLVKMIQQANTADILDELVEDAAKHNLYEATAEPRNTR